MRFYKNVSADSLYLISTIVSILAVERLEVSVAQDMEQYENGHHLAVGHEALAVAATFAAGVKRVFFQFWSKIFAELIENTENFY